MEQEIENHSRRNLDGFDKQILALLEKDAKMNFKEIAATIGLSTTPVFERIKRMERTGIIQRYTTQIDPKAIGRNLQVYCQVSLRTHQLEALNEFEMAVIELTEVRAANHIAGGMDYILLIAVEDMDAYQHFLKNKLTRIPHIGQVQSNFVMTVLK